MLPTPSLLSHVVGRERALARFELEPLGRRLETLPAFLNRAEDVVLGELPMHVARALTVLHAGEVSALLYTYEAVLEQPLLLHASRPFVSEGVVLDVLGAAELVGLFGLASPRIARQNGEIVEQLVERVARSPFYTSQRVFDRLRTLAFAFRMDASFAAVPPLTTTEALGLALPSFLTLEGGLRWHDLVWAACGVGHLGAFGPLETFDVVRGLLRIHVSDVVHESARTGPLVGRDDVGRFRRGGR